MLPLPPRYEYRRFLGAGGMGAVHSVFDRELDRELALKTFAPAEGADAAEGRFLFKQEFWAMASLRHPNLVAAYDYGELPDGTPFFTMEAVPGVDLAERPGQTEADVRAWLPGIASALAFLHARGYVHGDLKPENLRLHENGTPKLMDLGLLSRSGRVGGPIRGSLLYLAPEAIRQGAIDGRADLYALGAVLYHLLAGRPPFESEQPMALLRMHLGARPERLGALADVSPALESVVMRLLAKEPAERFANAGDLLAALGLAAEGLEAATLLSAPLIGREPVQAAIAALLDESGMVRLVGAEGSGKSRLLSEARAEAQLRGLNVLAAQGAGTEAPPYQALKPWLKALAAGAGEAQTRLRPVLARVLPELGEPAPALEGMQERVRLHAAIAELAGTLAAPLFVVDDADALDAASAELLAFLSAQATARGWRLLLAGRAEAEGAVALPPLSEPQVLELARALLGQEALPEAIATSLPVLAGGAPGLAEAILAHWIRTGALLRRAGAWELAPQADLALPGGLQPALEARFAELPDTARVLARVAAGLGAAGELADLTALSGLDAEAFFEALATLEAAEVLVRDETGYRFVRPAQATALAAAWDATERAAWHARAAAHFARNRTPDAPDVALEHLLAVARHGLAGTAPLAAVPWVLAAVRRSLAIFATGPCEKLLDAALASPHLPEEQAFELRILRAQWLRIAGRVDEALALYEETLLAPMRARGDIEHEVTYGILLQLKGRYADALAAFATAINAADTAGAARIGVRARLYAGRVAFFSGETGAAKTHLAAAVRQARALGDSTLLAGALSLYGYLLASSEAARTDEGLALLDEAIALNTALGDLVEAQEARNNQGNVYLAAGRLAEARRAFEACLVLCERMAAPNEAIFAHLNLGAVLLDLGELAAARAHAERALAMSRAQGRKFPEGFALALLGLAAMYQGELGLGAAHVAEGLALAREIKNRYLELAVLIYWIEALLHLGRFDEASGALAAARELAAATHNDEHAAKLARFEALHALGTGEPDAAKRLAALVEASRGAAVPLAHALTWQAYALRADAAADAPLAEAQTLAETHGLRLLGVQLAWLAGVRSGRPEDYEHAAQLACEAGAPLWEAIALAGWGRVDPRARTQRQEAPKRLEALLTGADAGAFLAWPERRELLEHTTVVPEVSSDRLHHLTDLMALVSAQPDLDAVMTRSLAALVEIAQAERGFLLLYEGFEVVRQVFHGMDEAESDAFSTSLAQQVLWSGEPLYVEDAQSDAQLGTKASIQALALRSVVGVPLFDGQQTLGVMLADSRQIHRGFTEADMDLALALARQVAITITNARRLERYKHGYAELECLHRLALATIGVHDLDALMAPIAAEAAALAGAERTVLLLGPELDCRGAYDATGVPLARAQDVSHSIARWVYENGEPLHLLDAQSDDNFQVQKSVMALGLRTVLAVPVVHAGRRLGVLYSDNQRLVEVSPQALHTLARIGELVGAYLSRAE